MNIGFSAPHATGKTTTAKNVAKSLGYSFQGSIASAVADELNYDLNDNPTFEQTLSYQETMLNRFAHVLKNTTEITIWDRTPLDLACYMMSRVTNEEQAKLAQAYVNKCINLTDKYFSIAFLPETDLAKPYEAKAKRPNYSESEVANRRVYQSNLVRYAAYLQETNVIAIPLAYQFDDRVMFAIERIPNVKEVR